MKRLKPQSIYSYQELSSSSSSIHSFLFVISIFCEPKSAALKLLGLRVFFFKRLRPREAHWLIISLSDLPVLTDSFLASSKILSSRMRLVFMVFPPYSEYMNIYSNMQVIFVYKPRRCLNNSSL